jgi:uncharacterized protein YgiM (DUF1202 family)
MSEPAPEATNGVVWAELPPSAALDASAQAVSRAPTADKSPAGLSRDSSPTVPTANNSAGQTAAPWEENKIVFLQRPGVNIRSAPSVTGSVLGTAAKGTRFKVTSQEGEWAQVEGTRVKGWINSQFLAPSKPQ